MQCGSRGLSRLGVGLLLLLQHGAPAKAYDMYIDLLNERHKGKYHLCPPVFLVAAAACCWVLDAPWQ